MDEARELGPSQNNDSLVEGDDGRPLVVLHRDGD